MEEKRKVEGLLIAEKLSEILARHKIPIQDSESLLIGDEILNLFYEELSKAREEGGGAERDRIFRGLDSIDCIKEALPKNYSASSMQLGINRAKEIVLEKELSKLTTK